MHMPLISACGLIRHQNQRSIDNKPVPAPIWIKMSKPFIALWVIGAMIAIAIMMTTVANPAHGDSLFLAGVRP